MGKFTLWNRRRADSILGNVPTLNIKGVNIDDRKMKVNAQTLISLRYKPAK